MTASSYYIEKPARPGLLGMKGQKLLLKAITLFILLSGIVVILIPLIYMISTSLKDKNQLRQDLLGIIPRTHILTDIEGDSEPLYRVTLENGETKTMAMIKRAPEGMAIFADPAKPEEQLLRPFEEQTPVKKIDINWGNYQEALTIVPFGRYLTNTLIVTFLGMMGMLISSTLVAYGFSRFRAPWLDFFFIILLSTIMLPRQVTLIPLYILYEKINWVDTLLPLIVPQFFANAFDVFLLRQFFMTIPLEQDEAARIDGASSFDTFLYIILPQSRAVIVTVAIFHFLYAWNDFYEPLIFLHNQKNWTMAVGLEAFNGLYSVNTHLIMAASMIMIIPPILLFFFSQKIFMQGVVISGSKG